MFSGTYAGFDVAVKKMHNILVSEHMKKIFQKEAEVMSRLRHPCIIAFYGISVLDGNLAIVMEKAKGSLRDHLESNQQLENPEIVKICLDVCSAVMYLHDIHNAIHGDISSANVLCFPGSESKTTFKLSDVGQAKILTNSGTMTTGCIAYAAPEVRQTHKSSKSSDVFAFGILCAEVARNEYPDCDAHALHVLEVPWRQLKDILIVATDEVPEKRLSIAQMFQQLLRLA